MVRLEKELKALTNEGNQDATLWPKKLRLLKVGILFAEDGLRKFIPLILGEFLENYLGSVIAHHTKIPIPAFTILSRITGPFFFQ